MSANVHHLSYLLRIWQDSHAADSTWRASLQSINGGETHGFRNLEELCAYLRSRATIGESEECRATSASE